MVQTKISAVEGNKQYLDGGAMFGNAPRAVWERWIPPDERGRIPLSCRALLIEHEGQRLLCETGIGCFFEPKLADRFGVQEASRHKLIENLNELGLGEEDIDYVILSHLHFDHAGGLLPTYAEIQNGDDSLKFPKARYIVGREAWERANNPHPRDKASFIPGLTEKLENSGRLQIVEGRSVPGVFEDRLKFWYSHGHTPGQMHTVFSGDQHKVMFAGDLIPGTPWVHLPITMGYDRYPEKLIDEKNELYETALPEKWMIFFTHDWKTPASFLGKNEKSRFAATEPVDTLVRYTI